MQYCDCSRRFRLHVASAGQHDWDAIRIGFRCHAVIACGCVHDPFRATGAVLALREGSHERLISFSLFSRLDADAHGKFVRISRKRQAEMDQELQRSPPSIKLSERTETALDFLPTGMRMHAIALRRLIDSRTSADIARASAADTETNMEQLRTLWCGVETGWERATNMPLTQGQLEEAAAFYAEISEIYMRQNARLRGRHRELMQEAATPPNVTGPSAWPLVTTGSGQVIQIQLTEPPKVPKFSGQEIDWANFRAQFEAEVHNNAQLSNAQKLRKLLGALEGRAKQAIGDWPTSDENSYDSAWQALCRQYGNDLNTICAHMSRLFALRMVRHPTAEALREILDTTRVTHRQLSLMLSPEKVAEYILLHRLERLMDAESQAQCIERQAPCQLCMNCTSFWKSVRVYWLQCRVRQYNAESH